MHHQTKESAVADGQNQQTHATAACFVLTAGLYRQASLTAIAIKANAHDSSNSNPIINPNAPPQQPLCCVNNKKSTPKKKKQKEQEQLMLSASTMLLSSAIKRKRHYSLLLANVRLFAACSADCQRKEPQNKKAQRCTMWDEEIEEEEEVESEKLNISKTQPTNRCNDFHCHCVPAHNL
jgi:hypothetical protein